MSTKDRNLPQQGAFTGNLPSVVRVGVVTSQWNEGITFAMRDDCLQALIDGGVKEDHIVCIEVPGSFELPSGAKLLLSQHSLDAVICIGCIIKGETRHDEYISQAVATGIMQLSLVSGKSVVFGVLTTNDMQQALDRAGGALGNKGIEAAHTALQMIRLAEEVKHKDKKKIGFS